MKYKKQIIISLLSILSFGILLGIFIFFFNKEDKVSFGDNIIKSTPYTDEEKKILSSSGNIDINDKEKLNKIYSLTRSICSAYNDYSLAVKSRYFTMLKKEVISVKETYNEDEFEFIYVILPGIVYESCALKDPDFNEKIVFYLQSEGEAVNLELEKVLKEELSVYIDQLAFTDMENIDKSRIKNDKTYFDDYFFDKNEEELVSIFYPYYIKEGRNLTNFLNKPSNTLNQELEFKNKTMTVMLLNLKILGFTDIEEFRTVTKQNYNITDIEEFKKSLLSEYKEIENKLIKDKKIDLKVNLGNVNEYKKFIESGEYKKLFEDKQITQMINELGKKMTIFNIISNDYADGINETWSGKEFFGSDEDGNNMIRLNFIYVLNLNADGIE